MITLGSLTLPTPQFNFQYNNEGSTNIRRTKTGKARTAIVRIHHHMIQMTFNNIGEATKNLIEDYIIANNGVQISMTDQYHINRTGCIRLNNIEITENYANAPMPDCPEQVSIIRNRRYTITIQFEANL